MDINEVIPPELLLSILDYLYAEAIASIPLAPPTSPPLDHHPLLDMILVCRSWHQVIMGNPTFWTFIWIGAGARRQDPDGIRLKGVLRRSGLLPLSVMIAPESVAQFRAVEQALGDECHRISTLTLVRMDERVEGMPSAEDVQQFLQHPFPSLKRLSVGNIYTSNDSEQSDRLQIMVDSPQLQELSSHYHFIFPKSPSYLTSISLTSVYPFPSSPLIPSTFDLPSLLDLRISNCEPSAFLSAFITPSLRKLFVIDDVPASGPVPPLRLYPSLEEVQWTDRGPDHTFFAFLPLCPNLIRYSNYQMGHEKDIKFQFIDTPATVLSLLPGQLGDSGAPKSSSWPNLEEVLLDVGTCDEISSLIHAIPSLKRVRILQNFTTRLEDEARQREMELLPSLRKQVDVAFWLDPWGSNLGMHFGERLRV
ncbi:hypothetical protein FS837_000153 [Tulasnella sp. UAMH 9824]|nr:hypothetical protein FS837_000153 [Tulasnella sp. UAMH 9824]